MDVVELVGPASRPRRAGRADTVSTLFRVHHRRLVGLAMLLVDDRQTAEDVVQDAFVGLHRRWRHLRDPGSAVAYLNRAVVNGARDQLRVGEEARESRPGRTRSVAGVGDMTTDLERRVSAVLARRAEDAMSSTDTDGQLEVLLDHTRRHDNRRRWIAGGAALAAAAAVAVLAVVAGDVVRGADDPAPARPAEEGVARDFIDAWTSFDRERLTSLADDDVAYLELRGISDAGLSDLLAWNRLLEAVDHRVTLEQCTTRPTTRGASVICDLSSHGLGSQRVQSEPFGGATYDVTVEDGQVVQFTDMYPNAWNGFDRLVWNPFAGWMEAEHPADWRIMVSGPQDTVETSPAALRLWQRYTREWPAASP